MEMPACVCDGCMIHSVTTVRRNDWASWPETTAVKAAFSCDTQTNTLTKSHLTGPSWRKWKRKPLVHPVLHPQSLRWASRVATLLKTKLGCCKTTGGGTGWGWKQLVYWGAGVCLSWLKATDFFFFQAKSPNMNAEIKERRKSALKKFHTMQKWLQKLNLTVICACGLLAELLRIQKYSNHSTCALFFFLLPIKSKSLGDVIKCTSPSLIALHGLYKYGLRHVFTSFWTNYQSKVWTYLFLLFYFIFKTCYTADKHWRR